MKVSVYSFSYRHGPPDDPAGNGGGFVFDCRNLPNPFFVRELKGFTGLDPEIADFFARHADEMDRFLSAVRTLLSDAIEGCRADGRRNDMYVAFGCTGGQHRSVFLAERTAEFLRGRGDVEVSLVHAAREHWITFPAPSGDRVP